MKNLSALSICVCISAMALAQYNSKNLTIRDEAVQFTYKNLRLYPIYANQAFLDAHKNVGKYTPLQQAIEQKKIVVTEAVAAVDSSHLQQHHTLNPDHVEQQITGGGERVNTLYVENVSNDTIMIMAGEVVKGGKQDRVLASDMILPPMSGKTDISVFCVEQGRWNYEGGLGVYGYSNCSNVSVRKEAVVTKSQQEVWKQVAIVTEVNGASTGTGTYTALDTSKNYNAELKGYLDHFKAIMKTQANVIGVVACTGDSILGCDMFATPDLFNTYLDNLLNSYATEAISNGSAAKTSYAAVQEYLNKFLADESKQEEVVEKNGSILKNKGRKLHLTKF